MHVFCPSAVLQFVPSHVDVRMCTFSEQAEKGLITALAEVRRRSQESTNFTVNVCRMLYPAYGIKSSAKFQRPITWHWTSWNPLNYELFHLALLKLLLLYNVNEPNESYVLMFLSLSNFLILAKSSMLLTSLAWCEFKAWLPSVQWDDIISNCLLWLDKESAGLLNSTVVKATKLMALIHFIHLRSESVCAALIDQWVWMKRLELKMYEHSRIKCVCNDWKSEYGL